MTTRLVSISATRAVELLAQLVRKQLLPVPSPDRYGEATIGTTGVPTLVSAASVGISGISRGANAGLYTITLSEHVTRITGLSVVFRGIGDGQPTGVPASPIIGVLSRTTNSITFQCSPVEDVGGDTPWWADPADGEEMYFRVFCEE